MFQQKTSRMVQMVCKRRVLLLLSLNNKCNIFIGYIFSVLDLCWPLSFSSSIAKCKISMWLTGFLYLINSVVKAKIIVWQHLFTAHSISFPFPFKRIFQYPYHWHLWHNTALYHIHSTFMMLITAYYPIHLTPHTQKKKQNQRSRSCSLMMEMKGFAF